VALIASECLLAETIEAAWLQREIRRIS
jgi:hypothetical protein